MTEHATKVESTATVTEKDTVPGSAHKQFRWHGLSLRYTAIVLGSGLLMFAGSNRVIGATTGRVKPQVALVLLAALLGMACLILAALPISAPLVWQRWCRRLRLPLYILAAFLVLGIVIVFTGTLNVAWRQSPQLVYQNDVLSFTHVNAQLVLAGKNPYTSDSAFTAALQDYPDALPTPMRRGILGAGYDGLDFYQLTAIRVRYLTDPQATDGALDPRTLHSYPALSFLFYAPFLWAGLPNILLLNLLICWGVLAWIGWQAPAGWRLAALLTAGTAFCIAYSLPADTEIVCIALLLAAWHLQHAAPLVSGKTWRSWSSWLAPVLLGLACAFKQYSWFFAPFFVLDMLLSRGGRETLRWGVLVLAAFLLPNLPYLIASPGPWLQSLFLPMTDPLFPQGIGIMALSLGHLLPYGPPVLYAAMEVVALLGALWLQWRYHARLGDAVLLLALVPFLFAFRSPPNYFAFAPWLALYAANRLYSMRIKRANLM